MDFIVSKQIYTGTAICASGLKFTIRIPDVAKFQHENDATPIQVNVLDQLPFLLANPWSVPDITKVLLDVLQKNVEDPHVQRILRANIQAPIACITVPADTTFHGRVVPYFIIDGYHRLARAMLHDRVPTLPGKLYVGQWIQQTT